MIKEKTEIKTDSKQLAALYQEMKKNNDQENAEKVLYLYKKLVKEELVISFSGHFSAGKSSIINELLEENILPKSPIPTSANIVKITSGEGWARVFFNHAEPVEYTEPYDIDMIKEYSMDKDTIERIEISTSKEIIPRGAAIIDTPGIDAADDADRLMTEGALYLVDVLFYVMDYNHVQSEVNLYFLKSLQENQIPFYLIINQIDKHNEAEISFEQFVESIKQTFSTWEISPENIFFTSLYDFSIKKNQFHAVKDTIFSMMETDRMHHFNIDVSVQHVIKEHKQFLKDQYEALYVLPNEDDKLEGILDQAEELEANIEQLTEEPQELEKVFYRELNTTLQNAYLMPKELRDKAERFLESEQNGFKVGIFGSKRKTAEEKDARLADFVNHLKDVIETAIQWKLRDKLLHLSKDYSLTEIVLQEEINNLSIAFGGEEVKKLINPNAQVNGDYVLNYTNDVASAIKKKFKRQAVNIAEHMKTAVKEKNAQNLESYKSKLAQLQEAKQLKERNDKIQQELKMKQATMHQLLLHPIYDEMEWEETLLDFENRNKEFSLRKSPIEMNNQKQVEALNKKPTILIEKKNTRTIRQMQESIDKTLSVIEELPGFNDLKNDLLENKETLANQSYTIALFGAFSAGKSSFSNALLGQRVLPVSPNPTTATVNRIRPVTNKYPHGTVVVKMKDEEAIYNELKEITSKFSPDADSLSEFISWLKNKKIYQHEKLSNTYQSYIQALISGYEVNEAIISKEVTISLEEFTDYVTDETKACYIEVIDLYYACTITNKGITLVDTPGADSVNARHTNVAFNYIKHADAILYVTYYNHALSRADRDFLMQLGRVKEVFQLDKMFFIINASDLAENDEELHLVTSYVNNELTKLGIRHAKLFPVSSKLSLEEKLVGNPLNKDMMLFEENFYQFIHHDLAQLIIESSLWDIKRTYHTLKHYINSINLDRTEKERQKQEVIQDKLKMEKFISSFETTVYNQQIEERIKKQLYYVVERLGIRFHDMFKEFFNPTTITENGRKAKTQLKNALENLLEYVQFELKQEMQAVSLRIEAHTQDLSKEVYNYMKSKSADKNEVFELPDGFRFEIETPRFEEKIQEINISDFNHVLERYKGTKSFFEKNEKEIMKEGLFPILLPFVQSFIAENENIMIESFLKQWESNMIQMKEKISERLEQNIQNYFAMLDTPTDVVLLKKNLETLEGIVYQYKGVEKI